MALLEPGLSLEESQHWTTLLMRARRAKGVAMRSGDHEAREAARQQIEQADTALGERGEPWWTGGAKDWNRYMAKNTPYAEWLDY